MEQRYLPKELQNNILSFMNKEEATITSLILRFNGFRNAIQALNTLHLHRLESLLKKAYYGIHRDLMASKSYVRKKPSWISTTPEEFKRIAFDNAVIQCAFYEYMFRYDKELFKYIAQMAQEFDIQPNVDPYMLVGQNPGDVDMFLKYSTRSTILCVVPSLTTHYKNLVYKLAEENRDIVIDVLLKSREVEFLLTLNIGSVESDMVHIARLFGDEVFQQLVLVNDSKQAILFFLDAFLIDLELYHLY